VAVIYLRSTDGNDADNGSTWALAKATLAAALTASAAGDTIYMSQSHAETKATQITLTSPGSAASPVRVICVNDGAAPPTAVATTVTVTTTSSASILINGYVYFYGVNFSLGSAANSPILAIGASSTEMQCIFDTCQITMTATGAFAAIQTNYTGATGHFSAVLNNTNITFTNVSQGIIVQAGSLQWRRGAIGGATFPTTLFQAAARPSTVLLSGLDLSGLGSGKSLFAPSGTVVRAEVDNCKLGASVSMLSGALTERGSKYRFTNCDSADTNYRYHQQEYQGTITHEATIVRTGGANDGTTAISRKMVSTANSSFYAPLELGPLVIWNDLTSSLTVTVHIVTDNVTLTDAQCWIEVEELGTSGYPLSVTQSDRAADILATPANQTTSTEAWTTTGLTTPVYQKLNVTFTPAEKGPIKVRVMLAKASTTVYVCPKVEVS
jgi:hypothetical protein